MSDIQRGWKAAEFYRSCGLLVRPRHEGDWQMRNVPGDRFVGPVVNVSTERLIELAIQDGWIEHPASEAEKSAN